jgi:xanthosine utilization system XapX-like protein
MHWLAYIALIWLGIYLTAIFIAFLMKFLLPIPPVVAAASGLIGGLIGVFYVLIKQAEHPVQGMIDGLGSPQRPEANIGDLVGEEDFGGIIEELREQNHGDSQEDAEDRQTDQTRQ